MAKNTLNQDAGLGMQDAENQEPVTQEAAPLNPEPLLQNPDVDPYHGQGGSYIVDDATQTRRPNN